MDQHPIPRQVTTFEFRLIGFMTLKQFLYFVAAAPFALMLFFAVGTKYLNIVFAAIPFSIAAIFAFFPVNDRPLTDFLRNLFKRLTSATQYTYHKDNLSLAVLDNLYFQSDPHLVVTHVDSQEKLAAYTAMRAAQTVTVDPDHPRAQSIGELLNGANPFAKKTQPAASAKPQVPVAPIPSVKPSPKPVVPSIATPPVVIETAPVHTSPLPERILHPATPPTPVAPKSANTSSQHPFLTGNVLNRRHIGLPGVLVYLKDDKGATVRILKSNPHGVFATFHPLDQGTYTLEAKDTAGNYFFDTMNVAVKGTVPPIQIVSREMM